MTDSVAFGDGPSAEVIGPVVRVDDAAFVFHFESVPAAARDPSVSTYFFVAKEPTSIDPYLRLAAEHRGGNIVELGVFGGGSTALLAVLAEPAKFVALDITAEPVEALESFLDDRSLRSTVRTYYGVAQADRDRLSQIMTDEFGDQPLDLVIDDASHYLLDTRISFDLLFPRLRPGGSFVIEDWNWAAGAARKAEPYMKAHAPDALGVLPLEPLVLEAVMAAADEAGVVDAVEVEGGLARVRRGPAELDPHSFHLADHVNDRLGLLSEIPPPVILSDQVITDAIADHLDMPR